MANEIFASRQKSIRMSTKECLAQLAWLHTALEHRFGFISVMEVSLFSQEFANSRTLIIYLPVNKSTLRITKESRSFPVALPPPRYTRLSPAWPLFIYLNRGESGIADNDLPVVSRAACFERQMRHELVPESIDPRVNVDRWKYRMLGTYEICRLFEIIQKNVCKMHM